MKIEWSGVREFDAWLRKTPESTTRATAKALTEEGENTMRVSKKRTPVDTGNLRASGHVKPATTKRSKVTVELAYGTDYAIYVHERPALHPSGQMKYLESAVRDSADGMAGRLKDRIAASLKGGA